MIDLNEVHMAGEVHYFVGLSISGVRSIWCRGYALTGWLGKVWCVVITGGQ